MLMSTFSFAKVAYSVPQQPASFFNRDKQHTLSTGFGTDAKEKEIPFSRFIPVSHNPVTFGFHIHLLGQVNNSVTGVIMQGGAVRPYSQVCLYNTLSGMLVTTTVSDSEGVFTFKYLNKNTTYFILAHDPKKIFNTVILNNIILKDSND